MHSFYLQIQIWRINQLLPFKLPATCIFCTLGSVPTVRSEYADNDSSAYGKDQVGMPDALSIESPILSRTFVQIGALPVPPSPADIETDDSLIADLGIPVRIEYTLHIFLRLVCYPLLAYFCAYDVKAFIMRLVVFSKNENIASLLSGFK